jgi:hypothetical protein
MRLKASLIEILKKAGELHWDQDLYVPRTEQLIINSTVIVLNNDEETERSDNTEPEYTETS